MEYLSSDVLIGIISALAAGSLIGLERTYHGRPAGFRTHALVCTASALLMLLTTQQWQWIAGAPLEAIRADPTRMAQGIMTGIGFLGAGVIFKEGVSVRGLTTAASIWMTSALGILYGVGLYAPAALGTVATLIILGAFRVVEGWMPIQVYAHLVMRFATDRMPTEEQVRSMLEGHGFTVATMSYAKSDAGRSFDYRTVIMSRRKRDAERLAQELAARDDLLEFTISPTAD
jgi:putative Mg2+ transporter-C (MgtC) family protein